MEGCGEGDIEGPRSYYTIGRVTGLALSDTSIDAHTQIKLMQYDGSLAAG